jgi:hypothetical protein
MPISPLWAVVYSTFVIYFHRSMICFCCSSRSPLTDANISSVECYILDFCYLFSQVQDFLLLSIQKLFNRCQYLLCGVFYTRLLLFIFTGPGLAFVVYPEALLTDANISPVGCFILDFCYLFSQVQDLLLLSIQKIFNRCQYLLCGVFYTRLLLFIFTGPGPVFVVYPGTL